MGVREAIIGHASAVRELERRELPGGSYVVLYGRVSEPRYEIVHEIADRRVPVILTNFADEAEGVFNAFDGKDRGWHSAYLPIGRAFPDSDAMTTKVLAVGSTVLDCVWGFLQSHGEGLKEGTLVHSDETPDAEHQWSVRFASDSTGTGWRAWGRKVPGGYVMTGAQ